MSKMDVSVVILLLICIFIASIVIAYGFDVMRAKKLTIFQAEMQAELTELKAAIQKTQDSINSLAKTPEWFERKGWDKGENDED